MFYADLHVHSKYSRATSRNADLENMAIWAQRKGISVIGTGDFTHPEWMQEIRDKLVPAEPGLFRLRDDIQRAVDEQVEGACHAPVRFMLEVEISTIYKKGEKTRKVHHLVYAPDLEKADRIVASLDKIGNLKSDGRPILGLDSRDLLEITLDGGEDCYLIPAHIWTPWFAAMGSKSGFDSIEDCYGDLASHIFAIETGLSSDPAMNWRLSILDRFTMVSNSDAHSPPKLGREACVFETDMDYFAMKRALETREGYGGTVEFFPEEGKYHMDGHRNCGVRQTPDITRTNGTSCPECGKAMTVGVLNRVDSLADRPVGYQPDDPMDFRSLIPLPEVISEIRGVGEKSKRVQKAWHELIGKVGNEMFILNEVEPQDISRAGAPLVAEAVQRMRNGEVIAQSGYDGEYGVIRVFQPGELAGGQKAPALFEMPAPEPEPTPKQIPQKRVPSPPSSTNEYGEDSHSGETVRVRGPEKTPNDGVPFTPTFLDALDPQQRSAAEIVTGPLLIVAGPGTGKTRTLTHRIAHLITAHNVEPESCLAVTFSRRAAAEMSERLQSLLPDCGERIDVLTFHSLGLTILREHAESAGISSEFRVAGEIERRDLLVTGLEVSDRKAGQLLSKISAVKRSGIRPEPCSELAAAVDVYTAGLQQYRLVDFDDLILLPAKLLERDDAIRNACRDRWKWISIDEYQDIDSAQFRLIRQLAPRDGNVCAIGDPDQSIYGFRGAGPEAFLRFAGDFSDAKTVQLSMNYRSSRTIVSAAEQVIKPGTLVTDRQFDALSEIADQITIRSCPTDKAEAEFVVHSIEKLVGGSTFFSIDSARVEGDEEADLSFSDMAVLFRTESQAEALIEAFARSGMPFQLRSHKSLTDEPAVQRLIEHLQNGEEAEPAIPVTELLKQAANKIWDDDSNAAEFLTALAPIAERCGSNRYQFLSELALGADVDLWDPRAQRVTLMTLHASKGLEFPVVFIVGCEDGLLPLKWSHTAGADIDEERRLFFVGMTRAQRQLYLSYAKKRPRRGSIVEPEPSPFLREIEEELLRRSQSRVPKRRKPTHQQLELFG